MKDLDDNILYELLKDIFASMLTHHSLIIGKKSGVKSDIKSDVKS